MNEHHHNSSPAEETTAGEDKMAAKEQVTEEPAKENDETGGKKKKKAHKEASKVQEMEAEISELKDKYLRLYAEFDNYKRRTIKERLDLMRTAAQDTLTSLLTILDDFDRAKKIADDPATVETFTDGVELVYQKLYATLKSLGVHPMESNGKDFDPEQHAAITEIEASPELKGKVVDTIEKGYYLHDKIIRHAKVVTGK